MSILISKIPSNSTLFVFLREEKQKFKIFFHYSLFWAHFSAAGNSAANQQASLTSKCRVTGILKAVYVDYSPVTVSQAIPFIIHNNLIVLLVENIDFFLCYS